MTALARTPAHLSTWGRRALLAAALFGSTAAHAGARLVVALEERIGVQAAAASETEVALMEALAKDDRWVFVDADQSRKVRKAAGAKSLLDTSAADLVTSLTADVLVVGRVELVEGDAAPFKDVSLFRGTAQIKLIAVDSAEVVGAFRVSAAERDFSAREAQSKVAGALAKAIAAKLALPGPTRVGVEVALERGLSATEAEALARCVGKSGPVDKVEVRHYDAETLLLDLQSRAAPAELVRAVTGAGCGLKVVAYSARQLRLEHGQKFSLELLPAPLTPTGKVAARDRWVGEAVARGVATELSRLSFLRLAPADAPAKAVGAAVPGRLVLSGTYRVSGETVEASVELVAALKRRVLFGERASCTTEEVSKCVAALGAAVSSRLLPALKARPGDIPLDGAVPEAAPELLSIERVELSGVYPSRVGHYHQLEAGKPVNPLGWVVVRNTTAQPITALTARAEIPGLSEDAPVADALTVAAGQTARVPVYVRLDLAKLAARSDNRSEVLDLRLVYQAGELTYPLERRVGVMVYERNAVSWSDDKASVAAFVSPRSPSVRALADAVQAALPAVEPHPLAVPIGLFEALAGLRYRRDGDNPFNPDALDDVLYPAETLARGGGDCDDLAVTYASLLEAAGWPAMLVQTAGHVFVAVGTEVPPANAGTLSVDRDALITHQHTLWVPIETTQVGRSFAAAWATAARELRAVRESGRAPTFIRVKDAWRRYPPVELAAASAPAPVVRADLSRAVSDVAAGIARDLAAAREALRTATDPASMNRYGVLLAQAGQHGEAQAVFERSRAEAERGPVLNNLGNLELLAARPEQAYALYERAIGLEPERLEVRVNAVLSLHTLSRGAGADRYQKAFVAQVLALHERDPELVAALGERLPHVGKTGSAEGATTVEGLAARITEVLKSRGARAPEPLVTRSRPGDTGLERHVSWLN